MRRRGASGHQELHQKPAWGRTGNGYFPAAAAVEGSWWVLRLNDFPDHPPWTLFVDGARRFDFYDTTAAWDNPLGADLPRLGRAEAQAALMTVAGFEVYGSEVGQPCDNPFCCPDPARGEAR